MRKPLLVVARELLTYMPSKCVVCLLMLALLAVTGCSDHSAFTGITPTPALPTPHVQLPAAPTGLAVTAGDGQITLSWSSVSSAASYNIYWGNAAGVTTATGTKIAGLTASPYPHTSLSNGTIYYYVVTAVNSAGESATSAEISATPIPPVPAAPTGLAVTTADGQITLSWSSVSNATSYNIYWANATGVTAATGTKIGSLTASPYAHTSLTNGTNYYYIVTAVNSGGESAASAEISAMPMPPGAVTIPLTPGTPTNGTLAANSTTTLNFSFDGHEVTSPGTAIVSPLQESELGTPLPTAKKAVRRKAGARLTPLDPGCTFVGAFHMTTAPSSITTFATPATVGGSVDPTISPGTTLNLAVVQSTTWSTVATLVVGTNGGLTQNLPSVDVPGLLGPGQYVLCKPKPGGTTVSNLGIALIADDSNGSDQAADSVQVVHIYDAKGNPLATPTVDYLNYPEAGDLDGQALTPDGSQGILVDGGNTVRFFSKVQTGTPVADSNTLDVSAYGYDGDSIAILPDGDEAVVSLDSGSTLILVSGILSGTPVVADTIAVPGARDSVAISNDGSVLLARGYDALTIYSIASVTPHPGSIAGTVAHSFTQVANAASLASNGTSDGRGGMAISPVDSSRALLLDAYGKTVTLLTGLPGNTVVGTPLDASVAGYLYSISITPDGKSAVVGGENGLLLISGVNTASPSIVGSVYAPTYSTGGGTGTLGYVQTLGITLDGKYVVACDSNNSSLLVIPVSSTGFATPVGVLNNFAVPDNDQMLMH